MVWGGHCKQNTRPYNENGKICCPYCGRVLAEDNFSEEVTFVKNAAGQSQLAGNLVKTVQEEKSVSERTLQEAYDGITSMMFTLNIDGDDSIALPAKKLYGIAAERNFMRGRNTEQVQAACLYILCSKNDKPYLLINFLEYLRINFLEFLFWYLEGCFRFANF